MNKKQILQGEWRDCGLNLAGSRPADSWNAQSWKCAGQICVVIYNHIPRWKALLSYWLCCMFHSICLKMKCKLVSDLKIIIFLFSLYIDGSIVPTTEPFAAELGPISKTRGRSQSLKRARKLDRTPTGPTASRNTTADFLSFCQFPLAPYADQHTTRSWTESGLYIRHSVINPMNCLGLQSRTFGAQKGELQWPIWEVWDNSRLEF